MLAACWILSLAVHSLYLILFTGAICRYKKPSKTNSSIFLSVIVASHNELTGLKRLIPLLLSQKHVHYEIILALDRSSDGSIDFLKKLDSELIKIIEIKETPTHWDHKKFALQQAIDRASGEWLVFTDADCVPYGTNWLRSFLPHISGGNKIILGVSPYQQKESLLNHYICFETFQTAFLYMGAAALQRPYMAVGRNIAMERKFLLDAGGYHKIRTIVGGDDDLLLQQLATRGNVALNLGKSTTVYSEPKSSWKSYIRQKIRHFSVSKHYSAASIRITSPFHVSHLSFLLILPFMITLEFFWPVLVFYLSIKLVSFRFVGMKLGIRINYILLPIVDVMYALFTPIIALRSKLVKDIIWKN